MPGRQAALQPHSSPSAFLPAPDPVLAPSPLHPHPCMALLGSPGPRAGALPPPSAPLPSPSRVPRALCWRPPASIRTPARPFSGPQDPMLVPSLLHPHPCLGGAPKYLLHVRGSHISFFPHPSCPAMLLNSSWCRVIPAETSAEQVISTSPFQYC